MQETNVQSGIKILPSMRRLIHTKLAQFCVESNGSDLYHMMQAFEIIRSRVGDKPLKEHYQDKYQKVVRILHVLNVRLNKIKLYYDSIGKLDENEKEKNLKEIFNNEFAQIPLISRTLYESFEILLKETEIQFIPIPRECFKAISRKEKYIEKPEEDEGGD